MLQLFIIILAIILGYAFVGLPVSNLYLDRGLEILVAIILLVMGYSFGVTSINLLPELMQMSYIILVFVGIIMLCNIFAILAFLPKVKSVNKQPEIKHPYRYYLTYVFSGMKYLAIVISGIVLGYLLRIELSHLNVIIDSVLLVILFIIGHRLRLQGIPLKQILLNKTGIVIALVIIISSIVAGLIGAYILGLSARVGLVLSAGYGWYTLSGILTGQVLNHQFGTIAFFIDFIREIIAILFIPIIGRFNVLMPIGYSGATALDFTLPIIKVNLGEHVVPIAVTSGMILTILVPIVIPFFAKAF